MDNKVYDEMARIAEKVNENAAMGAYIENMKMYERLRGLRDCWHIISHEHIIFSIDINNDDTFKIVSLKSQETGKTIYSAS